MKGRDMFVASKNRKLGALLIALGAAALLSGIGLWLFNDMEQRTAQNHSRNVAEMFLEQALSGYGDIGAGENIDGNSEGSGAGDSIAGGSGAGDISIVIGGVEYIALLTIPALDLSLPVNNNWSDGALKFTPCRYSGDLGSNTLVVGAHNMRGHFLGINTLRAGNRIIILSPDGTEHIFEVVSVETVPPASVREVTHSDYDLTLFTCTYTGQARTVVRGMRA
jgi:sortase A